MTEMLTTRERAVLTAVLEHYIAMAFVAEFDDDPTDGEIFAIAAKLGVTCEPEACGPRLQ